MMRKKLPADRAMGAQESMSKPQWRATVLAIASAVLLGTFTSNANALALGRVTVQSALGEPLRAEIDIPDINAEEVSSLRVAVAGPDAFRAAGFEFNPVLSGLTITLQRRPDGRHFLQVTGPRTVNDPFIDLILETSWSSGRMVRDYTLLFDPPSLRQPAPAVAAQVTPPAAQAVRPVAPAPGAARAAASPASPAAVEPSTRGQRPAAARPAGEQPATGEGKQVTVKAGDTAGKIAAANKPPSVSLDQMLVALLRANPDAFAGGNVNRLRAGAVLQVPGNDEAALVPPDDAKQTLVAQSRDFNEFRRRLAEGLPTTSVGESGRQASGKLQAKVEEKRPAAASPDKLTLSKGAVQGTAGEDKIAKDRAAKDAAQRVAELNKNLTDLNRLTSAKTPAAGGAAAAASGAKPGIAVPVAAASAAKPASSPATPAAMAAAPAASKVATAPAPVAAPASAAAPMAAKPASVAPAAAAPASANPAAAPSPMANVASSPAPTAAASASSAPASATAATASSATPAIASASAAPVATAPAPAASTAKKAAPVETSLLDDLLENPIVPAAVGGVLAFLLGFGFYRAQQRKKSTQVDSSFLESRLQPDSFFGASGGQRIDTNEGSPTGSSMVYSPSQLDAAGDVDPVAEADVYLAYGRDLQAEEILKEALRTTPQRVAVHSKLLEIYAKRRDAKAFELVATEAYALTHGQGPEWEHICELGQELDPSNSLYRPGGAPSEGAVAAMATQPAAAASFGATTATPAAPQAAAAPVDLDLDLDFMIGDDALEAPAAAAPVAAAPKAGEPEPTLALPAIPAAAEPGLDMDFGSSTVAIEPPRAAAAPTEPATLEAPDLNLKGDGLSFDLDAPAAPPPPAAPAPAPAAAAPAPTEAESGMIEFDMGALSLDLPGAPAAAPEAAPAKTPAAAPAAKAPAVPEAEEAVASTSGAPLSTAGFEDTGGDPLATKLALAQEFNAIGDPDGARSLAQEVIAEASGDLKSKAQRFLAEIS